VQPERRQQPDLAKLAAALIELATEQLDNTNNTSTWSATASTGNASNDTTVTSKIAPHKPAPSRRRGRAA
jgi:hypothetical protein